MQAYAACSAAEQAAHRRAEGSGAVGRVDADANAGLQEMTRSRDALLAREKEQKEAIKELEVR